MRWRLSILGWVALGAAGCNTTSGPDADGFMIVVAPDAVMTRDFPSLTFPGDAAHIRSLAVDDDTLTVSVQFGGGCRRHDFGLVQSSDFLAEFVISLTLTLSHDGNGDSCERAVSTDLSFNLRPVADAYRTQFNAQNATVIISIVPPGETVPAEPPVAYTF